MALPTTTSISKLLAQLNILKKTNPDSTTKYVVLIQTGSYSPIRNVHIEALEAARAKIDSYLSFKVIGGYISLNGDFDVSRKLGSYSIPLLHRQSMAFIATKSSDWIDVDLSRRNSTDNITSAAVRLQNYLHSLDCPISGINKDQLEVWNVGGPDTFLDAGSEGYLADGITSICFFHKMPPKYNTLDDYKALLKKHYGAGWQLTLWDERVHEEFKPKSAATFFRGGPVKVHPEVERYARENHLLSE